MNIVYTNRVPGEERVHIELSAEEVAALTEISASHVYRWRELLEEADRLLNPDGHAKYAPEEATR
ncbi:hypothetical protein [Streptomyces halstedii]|uniref:hypothetical protein n=1 Tax=Streptomyces halstedii TaxID=1944 RepID=UPI003669378E